MAEQRNIPPPAQVPAPKAPSTAVKQVHRSPPVSVVKEIIQQPRVAAPPVLPPPSPAVPQPTTNQLGQAGKGMESKQLQTRTPGTKTKSKPPVAQKQQNQPKPQSSLPTRIPVYAPGSQKPAQKPQQSAQKQQPAQKQQSIHQQPSTQKQPTVQKQPAPPAKQQGTQQQQMQQKQHVQGKPQNQQSLQGKPAKQPKQKKGGKQAQQQQRPPRPTQAQAGKGKTEVDHTNLPKKPVPQPVGGSLRARMSSPPKLISAQVSTGATNPAGTSSLSAPAESSPQLSPSGTIGRSTEKRRLEEVDHTLAPIAKSDNLPSKVSPRERGSKVARREGDMDTSSALSLRTKPPSPSPPPAILSRLTMDVDDEKEEGEISDEEMQEPSPPPTGKASLLERLQEAPVPGYFSSPVVSSSSGIGSLAARMDPALMARIDPRGTNDGSQNRSATRVSPVIPAAAAAEARYQAHVRARNSPSLAHSSTSSPAPVATVNPAAARLLASSLTVAADPQPRTKAVIGRSGNMTTVNGVAISTGEGHGESKCRSSQAVLLFHLE